MAMVDLDLVCVPMLYVIIYNHVQGYFVYGKYLCIFFTTDVQNQVSFKMFLLNGPYFWNAIYVPPLSTIDMF
jgi:hypothetical protein